MAGARHVGVDPTVGTIGSAALFRGLVDLDVLYNEVGCVETLGFGVGLGVLEEAKEELRRLDGPAGTGNAKLLALSTPSNAAGISTERNSLLLLLHVLEESDGTSNLPAVDSLGRFPRVLEGDAKVGTAGAGRFVLLDLVRSVSNHFNVARGGLGSAAQWEKEKITIFGIPQMQGRAEASRRLLCSML